MLQSNATDKNTRQQIGLPKFLFGKGIVGKVLQTKPIHNFDYYWLKSFAAESGQMLSQRCWGNSAEKVSGVFMRR
jgi:uncharacterized protein affecting Mg2+/Co2+ transport